MTVIAMTREIGSRGSEVAAGVAAALGLEIINSEIVVPHVAGSLGVDESAVQRYLDGKASLFDRWQIDTRKLSRHTLDQILNLTLKDNVLIRGWGAAALFQGIRGSCMFHFLSIGMQSGPRIGIQKGPPFPTF